MILAFHRAKDNPGQLVAPEHLAGLAEGSPLVRLVLGNAADNTDEAFLEALSDEADAVQNLFEQLGSEEAVQEVIQPASRELSADKVEQWKATSTEAPTVEALKARSHFIPLHQDLSRDAFVELVGEMMIFDKHGPLDLILYSDGHEEIRKWGRNQIREMNTGVLRQRIHDDWAPHLEQPSEESILSVEELEHMVNRLAAMGQRQRDAGAPIHLRPGEKISRDDAYRSINQLLLDLGESITRCEDRQAFLSTSLFLFWACDTLMRFQEPQDPELQQIGKRLLNHYVSTGVLIEKQLETEQETSL